MLDTPLSSSLARSAELLRVDGTRTPITPKNGVNFQFTGEAYDLIGTDMIEVVSTRDGRLLLIDENGKLRDDATVNKAATALYQYGHLDPIMGNAIVCDDSQLT